MVRLWREAAGFEGSGGSSSTFVGFLLGLLVTLCILSAITFSCTDGVSKEKTSQADTELYGGGCAAGCGAGCGG